MPAWTKEEDEVLTTAVRLYGVKAWSIVACALRGRTGKQCRERYQHQLLSTMSTMQPKASAALHADDRRCSTGYPSRSEVALHRTLSTTSKSKLQVDTSCLMAESCETTPDEDDELQIETPQKRVRRFGHHANAQMQTRRSPWSAPPRTFDPRSCTAETPETPVIELASLGLPCVEISGDVELGNSSEQHSSSERADGEGTENRSCLPALPSSSVDWDKLVAIGSVISSPASDRNSPPQKNRPATAMGLSIGTSWHVDATTSAPHHDPADEAFLMPRPAVKLRLLQSEAEGFEEYDSNLNGLTSCCEMICTDAGTEQYLRQLGSRVEVSPLTTAFGTSTFPSRSDPASSCSVTGQCQDTFGAMSLCNEADRRSVRILTESQRAAQQTAQRIAELGPIGAKAQQRDAEIQRGYVHRQLLHRLLDDNAQSPSHKARSACPCAN